MRRFRVVDPGANDEPIDEIWSEKGILSVYFPYWSTEMHKQGKTDRISYERCLDDWLVINWAEELQ
jgi:hypothetical protein